MRIKVCNDGFMWFVLSKEQALALWIEGSTEIYKLYDDETEGMCDSIEDLISHNGDFGLDIGFVKDIMPTCPKCGCKLVPYYDNEYTWHCQNCSKDFLSSEI